ncbi:MAG: phosphatase PAP2 family protein [Halanaerobiales bacterium]
MSKKFTIFFLILIINLTVHLCAIPSVATAANPVDREIRDLVLENRTSTMDEVMDGLTKLGNKEMVIPAVLLMPENEMRKDYAKSLLFTASTTQLLKIMIGQKRPPGPVEYKPFTNDNEYHAMPSGHATGAFAMARVVAHHYPEYKEHAYILASLIAFSRVYKDRHWFSNVAAGAGVGYFGTGFVLERW